MLPLRYTTRLLLMVMTLLSADFFQLTAQAKSLDTLNAARPVEPANRPALIQPFQVVNNKSPGVTCGYGCYKHVDSFYNEYYALDFTMARASFPIVAAASGTLSWKYEGAAIVAFILHPGGWVTKYGHMANVTVRGRAVNQGDKIAVNQGEVIGPAGMTGADSIQLHFELRAVYNPARFAYTFTDTWTYPADDAINNRPNQKPNPPRLLVPSDGHETANRKVLLHWQDTGDPDNGPRPSRDFYGEVMNARNEIVATLRWQPVTSWEVTVPADGVYAWHVRSGDGGGANNGASEWSSTWKFVVNAVQPCPAKAQGDANCDNSIDLVDFDTFRTAFIRYRNDGTLMRNADFNNDGSVDLLDFEIFRSGYLAQRRRAATALRQNAAPAAVSEGSPVTVFFNNTEYPGSPGEEIDVDIMMRSADALQVSGLDLTVQYDPQLLAYVETNAGYASPLCRGDTDTYAFTNRFRVEHNAALGTIGMARGAVSGDEQLPAGSFCAGTIRFKVLDISSLATARLSLFVDPLTSEVSGPQAPLALRTDEAISSAAIDIGPLHKPTIVSADEATRQSVTLTWLDNANNEDGFRVYRWNGTTGNWDIRAALGPDTTQFTDAGLLCGTSYFYDVKAFNANGESGSDGSIASQTAPCSDLAAPTELAANATDNAVTLKWRDSSNNEKGFNIYRWNGVTSVWDAIGQVGADVTEYTDTGLQCSATYFYEVKAFNDGGTSEASNRIEVQTSACPVAARTPQPTPQPPVSTPPAPTPQPTPGSGPQPPQHYIFLPMTIH